MKSRLLLLLILSFAILTSDLEAVGAQGDVRARVGMNRTYVVLDADSVPYDASLNGFDEWRLRLDNRLDPSAPIRNPQLTAITPYELNLKPAADSWRSHAQGEANVYSWQLSDVPPAGSGATISLNNGPPTIFTPGYTSTIHVAPSTFASTTRTQIVVITVEPHRKFEWLSVDVGYYNTKATSALFKAASPTPTASQLQNGYEFEGESNHVHWGTPDVNLPTLEFTATFVMTSWISSIDSALHKPEVSIFASESSTKRGSGTGNSLNITNAMGLGSVAYSWTGAHDWTYWESIRDVVVYQEWVARLYQQNITTSTTPPGPPFFQGPPIEAQTYAVNSALNDTQNEILSINNSSLKVILGGVVVVIGIAVLILKRRKRGLEDKTKVY